MHVRFRLEGFYIIPNFSQFPATSPRHSLIRLFYQLPSSSPPESKDHPLFAFRLSLNMLYCKIPLFPSSSHSCPIINPLLKPQLQPLAPPALETSAWRQVTPLTFTCTLRKGPHLLLHYGNCSEVLRVLFHACLWGGGLFWNAVVSLGILDGRRVTQVWHPQMVTFSDFINL